MYVYLSIQKKSHIVIAAFVEINVSKSICAGCKNFFCRRLHLTIAETDRRVNFVSLYSSRACACFVRYDIITIFCIKFTRRFAQVHTSSASSIEIVRDIWLPGIYPVVLPVSPLDAFLSLRRAICLLAKSYLQS